MEHRTLAALIIRLTGLVVLVMTITSAARSFVDFFYPSPMLKDLGIGYMATSIVISGLLPLAIALFLIYFPGMTVNGVLRIQGLETGSDTNVAPLQRVAFSALGMLFMINSILQAVHAMAKYDWYFYWMHETQSHNSPAAHLPISPEQFSSYISAGLEFLLGLGLLIGSKGIANALSRLRG